MDRRAYIAAFVGILLLLFLGRKRILDIFTQFGGFDFTEVGEETRQLPGIVMPDIGEFRPGPELWTQTTGLICACNDAPFQSPVLVREIEIPQAPYPRYVTIPPTIQQQAAEPPRSYWNFGMNSNYDYWGDRPPATVFQASDGRMFLETGKSWNNFFIGRDEYEMRNGVIYYGPYTYVKTQVFNRSAST